LFFLAKRLADRLDVLLRKQFAPPVRIIEGVALQDILERAALDAQHRRRFIHS